MIRYKVAHGSIYNFETAYVVYDVEERKVVFGSDSKSETISESQRLNKYEPVDGDERTYSGQIAKARSSMMNKE